MPITSLTLDHDGLTLRVTADFPVTLPRLWDAYADPRQLEQFWGPPSWPATFERHDMAPGGTSLYYMTGPDGERAAGYWQFHSVDVLKSFDVTDGFRHPDGTVNAALPSMRQGYEFRPTHGGSRLITTTYFTSRTDLDRLIEMGMEEGLRESMGQIDAVLEDAASFAPEQPAEAQILSDTHVRVSRIVRATMNEVWRAYNDADLMQQWLLGPEGWTMPVCELADKVGASYRMEWENEDGSERFGFVGELLESTAPVRAVQTEQMIGMPGPATRNEMTLTPVEAGSLITLVIIYPDAELRDTVLTTGMTDGMEAGYARLEMLLAQRS